MKKIKYIRFNCISDNFLKLLFTFMYFLVLSSLSSCTKHGYSKFPNIGDQIPDSVTYYNKTYYLPDIKDSLRIYKYYFNGIKFFLEVSTDNKIANIFTDDSNFTTPEGIRVGDNGVKVSKLGKLVGDSPTICEYELPSKWRILLEKHGSFSIGNYYGLEPEKMKITTIRKYKELNKTQ